MPVAQLHILEGRTLETKQALIRSVTAALVETLKVKPENVRVIVSEVSKDHWGIGGSTARELGK